MPKSEVVNQTADPSENNKGEKDNLALSPEVRSVWLEIRDDYRTLAELTEAEDDEAIDNT